MEKPLNGWSDALSEQDIPAEVVDWESVTARRPEDEGSGDSEKLDAGQTIGEVPAVIERNRSSQHRPFAK